MDTKRVAEQAKHQNDCFDKRVREEKAKKLDNEKRTQASHLMQMQISKQRVGSEENNQIYPDLFEQSRDEQAAIRRVQQI